MTFQLDAVYEINVQEFIDRIEAFRIARAYHGPKAMGIHITLTPPGVRFKMPPHKLDYEQAVELLEELNAPYCRT